MQRYNDNILARSGGYVIPAAGASVTVKDYPAGTVATIYSDDGETPKTNPIVTGSEGEFFFYAADGRYSLEISGGGYTGGNVVDITLDGLGDTDVDTLRTDLLDDDGVLLVGNAADKRDLASTASGKGAALVGYISSIAGSVATTIKAKFDAVDTALTRFGAGVLATGRNANNLGQGLQVGGGDATHGADGTLMSPDGHASWLRFQPSKNESPVELVVYPSAAQGRATGAVGTSTITRVSGTAFLSAWIGKKIYFGAAVYRVLTVPTANTMTVSNVFGGTIPFASTFTETFHVAYFAGTGTCTVTAGVVTRTSGDPFIPFITSPYVFKLNGTTYAVSTFTDISTQTIAAPPANGTYTYTFETDINDQITTLRVQKMYGTDEENLSIYANYTGYHLRSFFAGSGQLRPLFIGNSTFTNIAAYADGSTSISAEQGGESVRFLPSLGTPFNRLEVQAAATGTVPTWRARGLDANVGMGFDAQGTGSFTFTSSNLTKIEFQIFGVGGTSWLAVQSDNFEQPSISANGAAANIDIKLAPKASGRVWLGPWASNADAAVNGYISVKDSAGNARKLATIA